jgi:hypothetical protein
MDRSLEQKQSVVGFETHDRDQILFQAKNTTAEQRFRWLEQALELFAPFIKQSQRRQPKRYF